MHRLLIATALALFLAFTLSACSTVRQVSLNDGTTECTATMGHNLDVDTAALAELARMATVAQVAASGMRAQKPRAQFQETPMNCPEGQGLCMMLSDNGCTIVVRE